MVELKSTIFVLLNLKMRPPFFYNFTISLVSYARNPANHVTTTEL
jgi:hypothetical protein